MKTIWIIDHYSSEPKYGGISRQYDFAKQLDKMGYKVVVVSSAYSHFTHSYITEEKCMITKIGSNASYVYLRTSKYNKNSGIKRAISMIDFRIKVKRYHKIIAKKCGEPDVVMGCSIHPLAWVAAYRIAKKYKVRFCAEVRDLWPYIWVASGEKTKHNPMVLFFGLIQKWAFNKADRIIYSMDHADKYICGELGYPEEKTFLIGQPMDCERFDKNKKNISALPDDIQDFISESNSFVCSFAGYYMKYEGVYVMLEAAKILNEREIPIRMVFIGSGQEKEGMLKYIKQNRIDNVLIYDRLPKKSVPVLLSHSDICMAHLEVEGHPEVYQYGVSKNKVNEYLYSGACTLYGFIHKDDAVATSGGGMVFEPYNAIELADNIEKVYSMNREESMKFGISGRQYIKENHGVKVLSKKLVKVLFD